MARRKPFIPSRPEQVTAAWCTEAMRSAGAVPGDATVIDVSIAALGGGKGLAGETVRLAFQWENTAAGSPDLPSSAIAKFASDIPVIKGLLESIDAYGREIAFYETLAAEMPLRVPQFLGGGADPGRSDKMNARVHRVVDGLPARVQVAMTVDAAKLLRPSKRRYALMIEDLGDDLVVHDVVNPPPPDQLRIPLRELARLHAAFWGRTELQNNGATSRLITWTPRLYQSTYAGRLRDLLDGVWGDWLTDTSVARIDEAYARVVDDLETINQPLTFVHGDPRSDNLLFSGDETEVTFVDWSLPGFGHPGFDVAYLLSSSLREEDAAAHVVPLIDFYLDCLAEGGRDMSRTELWEAMAATMRALLVQQVQAIPHSLSAYGDKNLEDYWAPRLLHCLDAGSSGLDPQT